MTDRRNTNRGYMKLIVWQDARDLYKITWKIFKGRSFVEMRIASNQLSSVDSIHRNIAEGYCRKGIAEYMHFLNIAQSSLGESVSSMNTYSYTEQIDKQKYEQWDTLAFKLENGLKKLIESLEKKKKEGSWATSTI